MSFASRIFTLCVGRETNEVKKSHERKRFDILIKNPRLRPQKKNCTNNTKSTLILDVSKVVNSLKNYAFSFNSALNCSSCQHDISNHTSRPHQLANLARQRP